MTCSATDFQEGNLGLLSKVEERDLAKMQISCFDITIFLSHDGTASK